MLKSLCNPSIHHHCSPCMENNTSIEKSRYHRDLAFVQNLHMNRFFLQIHHFLWEECSNRDVRGRHPSGNRWSLDIGILDFLSNIILHSESSTFQTPKQIYLEERSQREGFKSYLALAAPSFLFRKEAPSKGWVEMIVLVKSQWLPFEVLLPCLGGSHDLVSMCQVKLPECRTMGSVVKEIQTSSPHWSPSKKVIPKQG